MSFPLSNIWAQAQTRRGASESPGQSGSRTTRRQPKRETWMRISECGLYDTEMSDNVHRTPELPHSDRSVPQEQP